MKPINFIVVVVLILISLFVVSTVVSIFFNLGNFDEISVGFPYSFYETSPDAGGDFFSNLDYKFLVYDLLIFLGMSLTIGVIFAIIFR